MNIKNGLVISRKFFNDIDAYKSFEEFFIPVAL